MYQRILEKTTCAKKRKKNKKHTKTDEKNMSGNEAVFSIILAWFLGDFGVVWASKSGKIGKKAASKKARIFERKKVGKKTVQGGLPKAMPIIDFPSLGGPGPLGGRGETTKQPMLVI